jgi:rare lipoprotein A
MRTLFLLFLALALGACSTTRPGGYYQDDGPHARVPVDVEKIPDAVPRNEPRAARGNNSYKVFGVGYTPLREARGYRERGIASWYGKKFHGRLTSSGEAYDMYAMTAAHKTLPLPSYVRVRNLNNGRSVIVRVNDRGPFHENRLIDLSYAAAAKLGIIGTGTGIVEIEAVTADAPVVASRPVKPEIIATAHASEVPRLYLQVGAFGLRENAENLRTRLAAADLKPVHIEPGQRDGAPVWRVRLGPVTSVEESDKLAARVTATGLPAPIVVVEN